MNPNGNQGSFKFVVLNEFGIEQDFLRLFRLGTNVSNIINMKSSERKSYIASLLKDAEDYILLYKKLTDDMRILNSQISVLTNKLNHIGIKEESIIQDEFDDNVDKINELTKLRDEKMQSLYSIKGKIDSILNGEELSLYKKRYIQKQQEYNDKKIKLEKLENFLKKYESTPPINDVSKIIGGFDNEISFNNEKLISLEDRYKRLTTDMSILIDGYKISKNKIHIEELQSTYDDLVLKMEREHRELKDFNCDYSISFLTNLLGDINSVNILIEEISQYDKAMIDRLFNSDPSVIKWSKKQLEIINIKKIKLQKEMNSIRYSEKYESPITLYLPPLCPTKSCPYYRTHPFNIQKDIKTISVDIQLSSILDQCNKLDIEAHVYNEYPYVYSKLVTLKAMWKKIIPILIKLEALWTQSLSAVLTNLESRIWYDYDKIINTMELCEKRDRYNESVENLNKMKIELNSYKLYEDTSIEEKINSLQKDIDDVVTDIRLTEEALKKATMRISEYNALYIELSELSIYEKELHELMTDIENDNKLLFDYQRNIESISDNEQLISSYNSYIVEINSKLKVLINKNESIKATLNDIKYTKEEYKSVFEEKEMLKYILDAVSSKEGIPLMMVKIFLANSKDILNDLLFDVFDDSIEILDFNITEDEFYIPYSINGTIVKDIEKASQGQKSIISLALSFALIQNIIFTYNIMLLDEVDGPLYKQDRERFLTIFFKHLSAIKAEQAFLVSHNNTFDGQSVNIIMTSDELVDKTHINTIMRI